jgi:protein gp37
MFREQERYKQDPTKVRRTAPATFNSPLRWQEPRRIFTCSWSDFFHADADPWRADAWDIIKRTPQHVYQVLTKRPERIADHLPADWGKGYPNVWLGTSVENQRWTTRIPLLLAVPARVHWISAEPLLGPLNLLPFLAPAMRVSWGDTNLPPAQRAKPNALDLAAVAAVGRAAAKLHGTNFIERGPSSRLGPFVLLIPHTVATRASMLGLRWRTVKWVVVGGESGVEHRPMDLAWARAVRDQCAAAGVPFHFKQIGGVRPTDGGRLLDGQEWNDFPQVPA